LKNYLRLVVAACLYYSGLVKLALLWEQRSSQSLLILYYHRADGKNLQGHLRYLRDHYRVMPLEEALAELYTPSAQKHRDDRRKLLVITFDDGYRDNYTHGLALARKLRVPMTIFLIPGYIESGASFWWLEGTNLVANAQVEEAELDGRMYHLRQQDDRRALEQVIDRHARYAQSVAEREDYLAAVRKALAIPSSRSSGEAGALPLTWPEVLEMEQSGWITFGAHTLHHPVLSYLTDATEVRREVAECRRVLEERLGHPVYSFAYPIGRPEDIGVEGLQAVKDAGYRWALTTIEEKNVPQTDPHLLRRLPGDPNLHWLELAALLAGLLGTRTRLRQALRKRSASRGTATQK
jgi:peptidoglycan/xylan/chitin deacetylase (PgdA/CDA1 family)